MTTITARVLADSLSPSNVRITTLQLRYPRFIHSEFMTHRMFSRNAASSRAKPTNKWLEEINDNCAMPVHWGKNKPGMQAKEQSSELVYLEGMPYTHDLAWKKAAWYASYIAKQFAEVGYHKQVVNRLIEPFTHIDVIVTSTEWENFFDLRLHPDAQPEIQELASQMNIVMQGSMPLVTELDEWHLPYVGSDEAENLASVYDKSAPLRVSAARCARVSYSNHGKNDVDINKDLELSSMLLHSRHMSPFEHQAKPMGGSWSPGQSDPYFMQPGITHIDRNGYLWSGNFHGWIQNRQVVALQN